MNIYAQIIGIGAIIIWVLSISKTKKKDLVFLQIISNALYAVEYAILNATSASCMNILSTLRCTICYNDIKHRRKTPKYVIGIFILLMIIIGVFSYDGVLSIIPVFITILYAYSIWQPNMKRLYLIILFSAMLWIVYNSFVGAYVSIVGNIFEIIFALKSIKEVK